MKEAKVYIHEKKNFKYKKTEKALRVSKHLFLLFNHILNKIYTMDTLLNRVIIYYYIVYSGIYSHFQRLSKKLQPLGKCFGGLHDR